MKKKWTVLILYSLGFLPIWGMMFLDPMTMSKWTVFVGMAYTSISYDVIRRELLDDMPSSARLVVLAFPLFYVLVSLFFMFRQSFHPFELASPILFAFLLLLGSVYWLHGYFEKDSTTWHKWGVLLFLCYFYTVPIYSGYWQLVT